MDVGFGPWSWQVAGEHPGPGTGRADTDGAQSVSIVGFKETLANVSNSSDITPQPSGI